MTFADALEQFATEKRFKGKGPLSVALVITEQAKSLTFPIDPENLLTGRGGQVKALGVGAVQAILKRNEIDRVLAKEGGRTSRGSIERMRQYVAFLNEAHAAGHVDLKAAEQFWIDQVRTFFSGKPFVIRLDTSLSVGAVIQDLLAQAVERQKEAPGVMYEGTVLQHLVGAKLDLVMGKGAVTHFSTSTSDQGDDRTGDFDLGDVSVHVSTSPMEPLLRKCDENIRAGRRPLIVTTRRGLTIAEALAEQLSLRDKIDVLEFEQFLASNIYEHGRFAASTRRHRMQEIIVRYNEIIEAHETDPSLKIEIAKGK